MKTTRFISVLVCLFISFNVMANNSNPNVKVLSNVEQTAMGQVKVMTSFNEATSTPISQTTYTYDLAGNILEKVIYKWDGNGNWIGNQKLEYRYDNNNELSELVLTKWDNKTQDWSTKSQKEEF